MPVGIDYQSRSDAARAAVEEKNSRANSPVASTAGIYIHVPFCRAKCLYCDFYSLAERDDVVDRFVNCITEEIHGAAGQVRDRRFDTLYIGGGTPSLLTPGHLESIMNALQKVLGLNRIVEFTLEANPGEAPEEKLRAFRDLGVNRLSLGFQSFDAGLLKFLGRLHDPRDCSRTFEAARRAGFDNISVDILFNVPGQTLQCWQSDLAALVELGPEHISAYSLTVERGTPLDDMVAAGQVCMPAEEVDTALYAWTRQYLPGWGYHAYEISNYARNGRACRHNLHYWRGEPYLGFGPAAHGFDGTRRWWNVRDLDKYLKLIEGGDSPVAGGEELNIIQLRNEKLALGLRLSRGISVTVDLGYESVADFISKYEGQLESWADHLVLVGEQLSLTEQGTLLADTIAADLFLEGRKPALHRKRRPPAALL
ncbi:MAG: radical SAM family heme chaperone HemW [Fidelibacterota bacterium]|nr:MAG: radical SAM family heme chaperone HemW [Candidatus Neomarinimicrobiota bacterium]